MNVNSEVDLLCILTLYNKMYYLKQNIVLEIKIERYTSKAPLNLFLEFAMHDFLLLTALL